MARCPDFEKFSTDRELFDRWYDDHVKQGILADALIGTFSSFAHELAHNLVEAHNSEHEVSPYQLISLCDLLDLKTMTDVGICSSFW